MKPANLIALFENSAQEDLNKPCFQYIENNKWIHLTWSQTRDRVMKIAGGLAKLGIQKGDRVAILSKTRHEWTLADLGIIAAGAIVVPIYESNTAEQAQYILEDSNTKVVFVENTQQYNKILSIQDHLPSLKQIVYFDELKNTQAEDGAYSLNELMILGSEHGETSYFKAVNNLSLLNEVSYVYTSGTTGNPKGSILTHDNFISEVESALEICPIHKNYVGLLFLPLAHILGRVTQFFHIYVGHIQCYAESIDKLVDNIAKVRPHFMVSVPRIFEKIHSKTLQNIESASANKKNVFKWALDVGQERSKLILNKQPIPLWLSLKYQLAHKLVFKKLHDKLGGRIKFFISGGAPLSHEVALFFPAFGFTILEGYGLTETTAGITFNRSHSIKFGSVGQTIKGVELKIASDGEILVKGSVVFKGYFNNPTATAEAIDADGWFHTGDVGEFDSEGFLKITDRKKDIIVTAGGKNIAPQNIEMLMVGDPYISQFIVHGDKRKFLSALVVPDRPQVLEYAKSKNITFNDYNELLANNTVHSFIKERIEEKNKQLAKYESIKKFAIIEHEFTIESGELTPTLKLKRKAIYKKHERLLDSFYQE